MLTIDGKNINTWGAVLLQGSYNKLAQYPPLKKVDSNDWAEYDGLEVDLESPKLDKKDVSLSFYFKSNSDFVAFKSYLMSKSIRVWNFTELGKAYKLRFKGFENFKTFQDVCEVSVNLSEDFPMKDYTYSMPNLSVQDYGYHLDGVPFSKYGIIPLQWSEQGIKGAEKTKKALEITNRVMQGVKVAAQPLKIKSRDAQINCSMKLPIGSFWTAYEAFLYDLIKPQEREITAHGNVYKCHYKSAEIKEFELQSGIVWCEFDLKVVIL